MQGVMPPKPRPGASQILPGMPDAGWGRFAADARSAARRQGPLQAPLPPVLLASLVQLITIEVDGPAILQGLGTGAPTTEEDFQANSCTTYKGRALAVLRTTGDAGHIKVRAIAQGMPDATVQIEVTDAAE